MTKHPTDLLALLFGLAFTIAGVIVVVTQATDVDVSPQWGAAVGLIVLGVVALVATVVRAAPGAGAPVRPEDREV
jgi:uncharacterized membrane protein HdeD (DUF308 family)